MNKIALNIRYKFGYQFGWSLWYFGIYGLVMALLSYALIQSDLVNRSEGSLVYRIWGVVIFQFAISTRFKEDFDFWLTLSNTRKQIFQSLLGVAMFFSLFFSGMIVLERLLIDYLNQRWSYLNITDPIHFFAPYTTDSLFWQFFFFFGLTAFCSLLGLLLGSLFYRYGKIFRLAFWIIVSSIFLLILPFLFWSLYRQSALSGVMADTSAFLRDFNVLASSGYLLILTILLGAAAYLSIHRLPQK
ncbi:MAG: hypothetical protein GY805_23515 [Chloroflexi bacterium]|nr:hypothetical protein [Chloroflexota bacterium]